MATNFIENQTGTLAYVTFGSGPKTMICFHGYSHNKSYFEIFENALGGAYTFYSFDLFFHGQSFLNQENVLLKKKELLRFFLAFIEKENIGAFSLMGFSMGARFALTIFELYFKQVNTLILIAPDGTKKNFWYKLATASSISRKIFQRTIEYPGVYFNFLKVVNLLNLLNPKVLKFVTNEMDTVIKRRRVYNSWIFFRRLKFDIDKIAKLANENKVKVILVTGYHDTIIRSKDIKKFEKKLRYVKHETLICGHGNLIWQLSENQLLKKLINEYG